MQKLDITVLLGDPRLPDGVKRNGEFNPEDFDTVRKLKDALSELTSYKFAISTITPRWSATCRSYARIWC